MSKKLLLIYLVLFNLVSFAQDSKVMLTLQLKDGDVLSGYTTIRTIDFTTQFGTLRFPAADINRIDLGIKDLNINRMDVYAELDKLHFGTGDMNKQFDKLVEWEEGAIPLIRDYISSANYKPNPKVALDVNVLYEVLLSKHSVSKNFSVEDVLHFNEEYNVPGNYNFASIPLETPYGKLDIPRKRIKSIEVTVEEGGAGNIKLFKVEANKYISGNTQNGWLNTGMLVKEGDYLEINANGSVMLASLSNNSYTPDGGVNGSPGLEDELISYGQLIFKIGDSGKAQKAGAAFSGNASSTGILYLSIFESVFSENNSGHYNARVKVVK